MGAGHEALRLCVRLGGHPAFREILGPRIVPTDADFASVDALDTWMRREVTHTHHLSGTCKMGPSTDPLAVVAETGRVHGLEGLRVADASIMPDCIRANTNATCMMIGERMAGLIAEVRAGRIGPDQTVVFLHTGGEPGLFAHPEIGATTNGTNNTNGYECPGQPAATGGR